MARVLIVDDESTIRRLLGNTLDLESLNSTPTSGEMALELLKVTPDQVARLDVRVPGEPGAEMVPQGAVDQIRVFIAEEQQILRDSYITLLHKYQDMQIVGAAGSTSKETLNAAIEEANPQVILIGTKLLQPATLEYLKTMREDHPDLGAVFLSVYYDINGIKALKEFSKGSSAGCAYLLKHTLDTAEQLVQVIQSVAQGRIILDPVVMDGLMSSDESRGTQLRQLSPRELEVLSWVAKGVRNNTIAEALCLEPKTIERHINSIYSKLGNCSEPKHARVHAAILYLKASGHLPTMDFCDCL